MKEHQDSSYPAFPYPPHAHDVPFTAKGMALRDYFTAQALNGMLAARAGEGFTIEAFARDAYATADAMLVAQEAKD